MREASTLLADHHPLSWPWWAGVITAAPYAALPAGVTLFGKGLALRDYDPPPGDRSPLVSVVIPARDEAHRVARCVGSILASRYPAFEVIVVDDRSSDGTAEAARAAGADDARLRMVAGAELPEGWFGKPWACWQGARLARGTVLLFTDADTWHGPDLMGRAVGLLLAEHVDLVTLLQRQEMRTFWERVVQPHLVAMVGVPVMLGIAGSPLRLNQATRPAQAFANGQFIMVTRASYDAVGGHEAVRGEVVEDVMLARRYAEAGRRRWIANAMDDMATRMYGSLREVVDGWSKNLFVAARILWGPAGGYAGMLALALCVALAALPAAALAAAPFVGGPAWIAFGVLGFLAGALAAGWFLRRNGESAWPGLFYWMGLPVLLWILIRSTARGRRRIEWKGRVYRHA